jgi:DNA-binding transcriptional MerR regulator
MTKDLNLEDLATSSGLSLRTLRYYIQEGILQGPDTHGKNAHYSEKHLDRLELIQRMKSLHLPLQEIRHVLDNMTPDEITQLRTYQDVLSSGMQVEEPKMFYSPPQAPSVSEGSSALEYIQSLEKGREEIRSMSKSRDKKQRIPQSPAASLEPARGPFPSILNDRTGEYEPDEFEPKEYWTRIILGEGIELNIRQPKEFDERAKLAKLLKYAKKLFGDQSKKGEQK